MALGEDVQMTNAHYDAIRCPECHRRFDRIEKLNQHKLAKGHWAAHEHLEIFGDNQRRLKMTDHTTVDEENAPTVTEEPAQEEIITQQANRSEEHTSELQSQSNLVCRLLLEKKK